MPAGRPVRLHCTFPPADLEERLTYGDLPRVVLSIVALPWHDL